MGFEDPAADSGAEITSLKNGQKALITEPEVSPWNSVDLLSDKKKDQLLGYEPVYYPVKGAEPESIQGEPKIEFQASKRPSGSSLARTNVDEPLGNAVVTAINPKVGSPVLQKNPADVYSPLTKSDGGVGISADKKMISEPLIGEKKLPLIGDAFSAQSGGSFSQAKLDTPQFGSAVPMEGQKQKAFGISAQNFAVSDGQFSPLTKAAEAKLVSIGPEKQLVATGQGSRDWSQGSPLKSLQNSAASGSGNLLEKLSTSPGGLTAKTVELPVGQKTNELAQALSQGGGEPKFGSAIPKGSDFVQTQIPLSSDQKFTPTVQPKLGSALQQQFETIGEPKGGSLVQSKVGPFVQPQLEKSDLKQGTPSTGPAQFAANLSNSNILQKQPDLGEKGNQDKFMSPAKLTAPLDQKVGGTVLDTKISGQEQLAAPLRTQAVARSTEIKLEQPVQRTEAGANRLASLQSSEAATNKIPAQQAETGGRRVEPIVATTSNGAGGNKFVADANLNGDLPAKFNKTGPALTQIDKLTSDAQLRAQTERIAAGGQTRAQTDMPQAVKLKGEIATASIRQADVQPPIKVGQQLEAVTPQRLSPLTGKTTQDLVQTLKPQDRIAATTMLAGTELSIMNDRRNAASVIRTGADNLSIPYTNGRTIDSGARTGTAHIISGDVKVLTSKIGANTGDVLAGDKKTAAAAPSPMVALLNNIKEGKGDISRAPALDHLLSGTVKSTGDRYVGGEFILASMIIAAGAARRMPEQRAADQIQSHNSGESTQTRRADNTLGAANPSQTARVSPFNQIVDTISKAFTPGRSNDQTLAVEASRRANLNQGQNDSVRYISGVELAILLAAGGVTRLRSDKHVGQNQPQIEASTKSTSVAGANFINFNTSKQPLADSSDTHISTKIPAQMTEQRGERCIPGADIAIAAMLMLGGVTRRRSEERFPANPNELAQKVDRPFRLDRRLGALVEQAKSFVAREPMPVSGLRNTAADLVSRGEVNVPQQYSQGAEEQKADTSFAATYLSGNELNDTATPRPAKSTSDIQEALSAPTGWVHEQVLSKEETAPEEKLKKVEQDQQEGAGSSSAATLYRPIWIIAPGETFVSIAEDHFGDGAIAWLIADLNIGKFTDNIIEGKRVIEIQSRQKIELPVASDIEEFRQNRKRHQDAENIITIVTASQLDIELKQATFKQFLGTLQSQLPVPALAILPNLSLEIPTQLKPARALAPFGMSAPQFASIAAAVSLPLIIPQIEMKDTALDVSVNHTQESRIADQK